MLKMVNQIIPNYMSNFGDPTREQKSVEQWKLSKFIVPK